MRSGRLRKRTEAHRLTDTEIDNYIKEAMSGLNTVWKVFCKYARQNPESFAGDESMWKSFSDELEAAYRSGNSAERFLGMFAQACSTELIYLSGRNKRVEPKQAEMDVFRK